MWLVRNITAVVGLVLLTLIAARYRDYNKINNSPLQVIKRQNLEMRNRMESFSNLDQPDHSNPHSRRNEILGGNIEALLAEDTGFDGDEEDWEEDSDDSCDSTRTDVTYNPSRETSPCESVIQTPTKYQRGYNFRAREKLKLFTDQNLEESPETFSNLVKAAQRKQKRISGKIQTAQRASLR